jgi:hypothetical protein
MRATIKITKKECVGVSVEVQLFSFGRFYKDTGTIFEGGMIVMKLNTRKLYIHTSSAAGYRDLNVTLELNKFSNIALHVNVLENKYDLYVNDIKVAGGLKFLSDSEINQICTYADDEVSFVPSAKSNKMEDFLIGYARLARVNGWEITGDIYEFDNAKLYFSDTYLGTGDLKAPASQAN